MKYVCLLCLIFARGVYGSTVLFGPYYLNKLACLTDAYNIGDPPVVPELSKDKVKDFNQAKILPVIESSFYTGLSNQLSTCAMRLRNEYHNLEEDVVYPRVIYYLSLFLAKDYVRCHIAMTNLSLLKMVHYTQRMLMAYANSNFMCAPNAPPSICKDKYINGVVYIDIAEKLDRYRKKRAFEVEEEVKRILGNINNISSVKATGNIYLLVDAFCSQSTVLAMLSSLALFGFCSLV